MKKEVIEAVAVKGTETVTQEGDITTNAPLYTFRKLGAEDTFLMFNIIGKIGIPEFIKSLDADHFKQIMSVFNGNKTNGNDAVTVIGISIILELANVIFKNVHKCKTEIYELLGNVSDLSPDVIRAFDFTTFMEMVIDFIKKDEFKDFIKVVSKLFK